MKDKNGKNYSPTYLRTIHARLSRILNNAWYRLYERKNRKIGKRNMGYTFPVVKNN